MSAAVFISGTGVVSPAGWGAESFRSARTAGQPLPQQELPGVPGRPSYSVHRVPPLSPRPPYFGHARLRRSSLVSQFAVGAALEALGEDRGRIQQGELRLGVIAAVMSGGVNYSRRFYQEVLVQPSTASPLLFPETVFNAPASHLAAVLGCAGRNYTLVGDQAVFGEGLALAADWLSQDLVDRCLVVGAEEADWLTAEASSLFNLGPTSEGAGAVCLSRDPHPIELAGITSPFTYVTGTPTPSDLPEIPSDDPKVSLASLRPVLGEGFAAAGAWSCVAAIQDAAAQPGRTVWAQLHGSNHQAIGVGFRSLPFA